MAVGNAFLNIRAWEVTHQRFMPDLEQARVLMVHVRDFLSGRVMVHEERKDTLRVFLNAVCPDNQDGMQCLEELLAERRRAG